MNVDEMALIRLVGEEVASQIMQAIAACVAVKPDINVAYMVQVFLSDRKTGKDLVWTSYHVDGLYASVHRWNGDQWIRLGDDEHVVIRRDR